MSSDALPDDAWVQSFLAAQPRPLLSSLQRRLQASTTFGSTLAEVYKQRAAIESAYADSLAKLAREAEAGRLSGKNGNEWDKASGEGRMWDSVISELSETSSSHSTLSAILRTDFEQPLREMPTKVVAWRRIGEQDASLEKTLKDYEKTAAKLDKAGSSKSKAGKAGALTGELNQLTQGLSSLSPMVYTTYQKLDEQRLQGLKEVIVRWGTVRGDIASRDGERAERAITQIIGWEPADEVLAVGRRLGGGGSGSRNGNASTINSATSTPRSTRRLSTATSQTSQTNDFSPRPTPRQNGSGSFTTNTANPSSSLAGGFKSMLGRKPTMLGALKRDKSSSNTTPTINNRDIGAFDSIGGDEPTIRPAPARSAPPVDEEGFSVAPADRHRALWEEPDEMVPAPTPKSSTPRPAEVAGATGSSAGTAGFTQNFTSSPASSSDNISASTAPQQGQRLNLAMSSAPFQESEEERQAALAKMQQALALAPPQPARRGTVARGRRDVRNTMFGGVSEDGSLPKLPTMGGQETLSDMPQPIAPALGPLTGISSGPNGSTQSTLPPLQRQTSTSSVGSNNPFDSPGLAGSFQAPMAAATGEPGLRASLTETINVIMRQSEIVRVQITGEIHLSLRYPSGSSPIDGPIHIRLNAFEQLEKIAPNPAYLAQVPDKPGEYLLNSEILAGATQRAPQKGTLLFKYQVHVAPGKEKSAVPLLLEPAFMCKDGETRMILHWRTSDDNMIPSTAIRNVSVSAGFAPGVSVSSVQAKPPGGVWSPSQRQMKWNLADFAGGEGKIIAKFVTEPGEPMSPQGVQAVWSAEGVLSSGLGLEVVSAEQEGGLRFDEVKKGVVTGKYLAEAVN